MNRKLLLALLVVFITSGLLRAEDLQSRYGLITAKQKEGSGEKFLITLNGINLGEVKASAVSFFRINPNDMTDYVVIQSWSPGLYCHNEYVILAITESEKSTLSSPFGNCMELEAATTLSDGVQMTLRSPYGAAPITSRYVWKDGKLSEL